MNIAQKQRRLDGAIQRLKDRDDRIANRPKISDLDCAWAAGHFEGEGTVTLTKGGRIMHVRPLIALASTDQSCRDFFHDRWPGNCRIVEPRTPTSRMAFVWNLSSGERIQSFLFDVLPFIRTDRVRQKIEVVLNDIQDRGLYQQQPEVKSRSEQRRLLIRKLNAKGPDACIVIGDIRLFLPIGQAPLLEGPR
jgi:hypothetical protein